MENGIGMEKSGRRVRTRKKPVRTVSHHLAKK